ncbi:MAG: T9SS type A sorting domain-containing protein [candidate division Zixibacteria bacterium]|nr:T9SS type A sorting domain-containing protein [candidate division Zixibacteria bacterium]
MCKLANRSMLFCVILLTAFSGPLWAQWDNIAIDTITNTHIQKQTTLQSLDLDSYGYAHMTWQEAIDGGGHRIFYATNNELELWGAPEEIVDSSRPSFSPALTYSDFYQNPYVAYMRNSEIMLVYKQQFSWHHDQVTSNFQLDEFPTIAIDNNGLVHLAWITDDTTSGEFKIAYAYGEPGNWDIQVLAGSYLGPYGTGACPYIGISSDGKAHIAYRGGDPNYYHIHYAWNDSVGSRYWEYELIPSGNINDFGKCLTIDSDDDLHIAVSGNDGWGWPSKVFYIFKPLAGPWHAPELVSASYSTTGPSLDIDSEGKPHIVSREVSGNIYTGNIFYSYKDIYDFWCIEELIGSDHGKPSLKIDQNGIGNLGINTGGISGDFDICHVTGDIATSIDNQDPDKPLAHSYYLTQNYPNPFNAQTIIEYNLSTSDRVTIDIFDILGRSAGSLIEGEMPAGNHQVIWDAKGFSSGMYFYKIQAGDFVETKKMLLVK